jgi:hypothetical protein
MEGGGYIECRYTSMAQCAESATGHAAVCLVNPYFATADKGMPGQYAGRRRVH